MFLATAAFVEGLAFVLQNISWLNMLCSVWKDFLMISIDFVVDSTYGFLGRMTLALLFGNVDIEGMVKYYILYERCVNVKM